MNQLTPDQINRILAANTARCAPEAAAQIAEGRITFEQWQQNMRMVSEIMHTLHTEKETK